jgi:hypothetical protein
MEQCRDRYETVARTALMGIDFLKNPSMATARMPQFFRPAIATGRLAHGQVMLREG